jgi:hypothetical protein
VHHGPYVADLQTFLRDRGRQNDPVVFCDHPEISLLARIRCHHGRVTTVWSWAIQISSVASFEAKPSARL